MALSARANLNAYDTWDIAMGFRIARIPCPTAEKQVSDVDPVVLL